MALTRLAAAAPLVVLSSVCLAADTPPVQDRGGGASAFYMGFQGGVIWAQDKVRQYSSQPSPQFRMSSNAAFGGLHVGYQRTLDHFVVGLEADYDLGKSGGASSTRAYQMDYRSTLRARLGYDFGGVTVYATGGGALISLQPRAARSEKDVAFGATLGAGLTYKLSRNWSAYTEYRYADFGAEPVQVDPGVQTGGAKGQHRATESSVRAGATYHFR